MPIKILDGANMDIDLTSRRETSWKQTPCPWNEVENTHNSLPEEIRKNLCEEYGLVYFYRRGERDKPHAAE